MGKAALKTVNIDLPEWMIADLDREAEELGINRKAVINVLLAGILRAKKNNQLTDVGYLKAIEKSFASEWEDSDDDKAFKDL